jgi:hypothetical protein
LRAETTRIRAEYDGESYFLPLDDMAILFNPIKEPEGAY